MSQGAWGEAAATGRAGQRLKGAQLRAWGSAPVGEGLPVPGTQGLATPGERKTAGLCLTSQST